MPFQRRQQCQTCLKRPPSFAMAYLTCWNSKQDPTHRNKHGDWAIIGVDTKFVQVQVSQKKKKKKSRWSQNFRNVTIRVACLILFKKKKKSSISYSFFLLIKIPQRTQGALLPHPSFLSSMVKYVNKMSKVILQRGTKEKRGLREKTAIKFLRFSITLARGGPASSLSLAAGEPAHSIESHISNPTHKKIKKIKYLFSFNHQRVLPFTLLVTELSHSCWFLRDGGSLLFFVTLLWLQRWDKVTVCVHTECVSHTCKQEWAIGGGIWSKAW